MSTQLSINSLNPILESLQSSFIKSIDNKIKKCSIDEKSLKEILEESSENQLLEIINGLSNVAAHYPTEVINWLIGWHRSKINEYTGISDKDQLTTPKEPLITSYYEIYDGAYFLSLKEFLHEREKPLEKSLMRLVISLIYKILRERFVSLSTEPQKENLNYMNEIVCLIINSIASVNLNELENIFFFELDACQTPQIQSIIILTLRKINIKVFSIDHVDNVFNILTNCGIRLFKTKEKEVKNAYITMISEILTSFAEIAKIELNIAVVKNFIESLTLYAAELLKKAKMLSLAIPLSASVLCCSTKNNYFANYFAFVVNLFQFIRSKDTNIIKIALDCLDKVVWVYMVRYKCEEEKDKTTKFLSLLSSNLFSSSRSLLFTEFSHILIRIIHSISIENKDYTIHNIIKDLCQPPSTKHFSPEKMSVGLKAFIIIIDPNSKKEMFGFLNVSNNFDHFNRFSTIKNAVSKKNMLYQSEADPEKLTIIEYFFETLYHLDISYGRPFAATLPSTSAKFSTEQLNQDKKLKIILFKLCVSFIPKFFISNETMGTVAQLLSRLTLHTDEDMKARALAALKILIVEYIELRSIILQSITSIYLKEIPSNLWDCATEAISNIYKLAQLWRTCLSNELVENSYQDCFYSMEGFCLIALCSPAFQHRNIACQILKENKSMRTIFYRHDAAIECCLYDEIYKFLVQRCSIKFEGYSSNIELMSLFNQNFHLTPWYQVLACMFRDSQISYNCCSAVDYARSNSYAKFISSHSPIDPPLNYFESSSRLTLTKTKKSPFQCDSQSFQNYLILFCSPALIVEYQLNFLDDSNDSESFDILRLTSMRNLQNVLENAISMLKIDSNEVCDQCSEALSFTHSSIVPSLLKSISPLLKEMMDAKSETSTKKKRKRDIIVSKILHIFSRIAKSGHLNSFVKLVESRPTLQLFLDFCEVCRNILIPSFENTKNYEISMGDLATIMCSICHGLYNCNNADILSFTVREQYFKTFNSFHISAYKKSGIKHENTIEAMFSLLYIGNLLEKENFGLNTVQLIDVINYVIKYELIANKCIILDTIEILLFLNSYDQQLIDWCIDTIYAESNIFSQQLFLVMLNFFEKKNYYNHLLIIILSMMCIFINQMDSITYLRIRECLLFIHEKLNLQTIFSLPFPQNEQLVNCKQNFIDHLITNYAKYFIYIISDFFKIIKNCDFTYQIHILTFLQIFLKYLIFKNHIAYSYTNKLCVVDDDPIDRQIIEFEISVFIINNLIYVTKLFNSHHSNLIELCWISICCCSNNNFLFILHYLVSLGHFDDENFHSLLKIIIRYISNNKPLSLYAFLIENLINEQAPTMKVRSSSLYPYIIVMSHSHGDRKSTVVINLMGLPKFHPPLLESENFPSCFYCLPFFEIFKPAQSISSHCVLLIFSSYIVSLGPIDIDNNFITLMHLGINEMFSSNTLTSTYCKNLVVTLCMTMLNASNLSENKKSSILFDLNSLICNLPSSFNGCINSLKRKFKNDDSVNLIANLTNSIELINSNLSTIETISSNGSNQILCSFIQLLLEYFKLCGFNHNFDQLWPNTCIYFSTKCSSINLCCYSLFILRTLNKNVASNDIKKLMYCYCNKTQDLPSSEITKLSYEILTTIYTISLNLIKNFLLLENIDDKSEENKKMLETFLWFFTNCFQLEFSNNAYICINFLSEFTLIQPDIINNSLTDTSYPVSSPKKHLLFILINYLLIGSSHHDQCMLLLINLAPLTSLNFIAPNESLGVSLIVIIIAYYYIDFFEESSLKDLSKSFLKIIQNISLIPSMIKYYQIFYMFRQTSKRKDASLFLNLLFPEILETADIYSIKFLIKFLTDVIGLSEFKCIRNGLILLNGLIDHVGPERIPVVSKQFLLSNLPSFIKTNSYSKISYEVASRAFVNTSIDEPSTCFHQYMIRKFKNNPDFQCSICDNAVINENNQNLSEWIVSTGFFYTQDTNFKESILQEIMAFTHSPTDNDTFKHTDELISNNCQDCDLIITKPFIDNQIPLDYISISSNQMLDDIIETLNFLDQDLLENEYISSESVNKIVSNTSQTSSFHSRLSSSCHLSKSSHKQAKSAQISTFNSSECLDLSMKADHLYLSEGGGGGKIVDDQEIDKSTLLKNNSIDLLHSDINMTASESYTPSIKFQCHYIEEWAKPYLDQINPLLYLDSEKALQICWDKITLKCITEAYDLDKTKVVHNLSQLNNLIPILLQRIFHLLDSIIKKFYLKKHFCTTLQHHSWLKLCFIKIEKSLNDILLKKNIPYFILQSQNNNCIEKIFSNKLISVLIRISTSIDNLFEHFQICSSYLNDDLELSHQYIDSLFHKNCTTNQDSSMFLNLSAHLFSSYTFSDNTTTTTTNDHSSIHESFILYIIYEIIKYTLELIDFYHSYYEMIHSSILSINGQNITKKSIFYQMCKKSSIQLIICRWIENITYNISQTSNNIINQVKPPLTHFLSNLDDDFLHKMGFQQKSTSFDGVYSNWESNKNLTVQGNYKEKKMLETNTIFRSSNSLKSNWPCQKFLSTHIERGIAFSQTIFATSNSNVECHQIITPFANFGSVESLTDFSQCLSEFIILIITNLFK